MSPQTIQWLEILFDISYLIIIWIITILMFKKRNLLTAENKTLGYLFILAFFLLALGDTGHVGFRVPAYLMGGLEQNSNLVGLGSLFTSITVTLFYMIAAEIWRVRFARKRNLFYYMLMALGVARLVIMAFPQNMWLQHTMPYNWSLARNIPLILQGLLIASAMLALGIKHKDKFSISVSSMIFISYFFYMPVIFFVHKVPMLGMLMIPKTMAYMAIAVIVYVVLFKRHAIEK